MISRVFAGVLVLSCGCPAPDTGNKDSSTTNTGPTDTDSDSDTDTNTASGTTGGTGDSGTTGGGGGLVQIASASVTCDDKDVVTVFAETTGWSQGGVVFMQETGNIQPQYTESHFLASYDMAPPPKKDWDKLKVTLTTGAKPPYIPDVNTVFTCHGHFEATDKTGDPSVMTYIVLVTNDENVANDCMAFGHDPKGLLGGKYTGKYAPPQIILDNLDRCVVGKNITPK